MNSRNSTIRVLGQRSIPSTFIFRSRNKSSDCDEQVQISNPTKDSQISLSDFLNRKLKKNPAPHKSVQGKERPFSLPVSIADASGLIEGGNSEKESEQTEFLDVVLEQLKHTRNEKQDCIHSNLDGAVDNCSSYKVNANCIDSSSDGGIGIQKFQGSRKATSIQSQGGNHKQSAKKCLVVLGGDPRPKQQQKKQRLKSPDKERPIFNHYANGRGWWDCDMEGVDNDEVGHNEVWEGIGSTTLGGLDWH